MKQEAYYTISTNSSPREGRCTGHEDAAYVTNFMPNSGFERELDVSSTEGWRGQGGVTVQRTAAHGVGGSFALQINRPAGAGGGMSAGRVISFRAGKFYHVQAQVTSSDGFGGGAENSLVIEANNMGTQGGSGVILPYPQYSECSYQTGQVALSSDRHTGLIVGLQNTVDRARTIYIDNLMIMDKVNCSGGLNATTVFPYRDGDSPNWIWNADGTSMGLRQYLFTTL